MIEGQTENDIKPEEGLNTAVITVPVTYSLQSTLNGLLTPSI